MPDKGESAPSDRLEDWDDHNLRRFTPNVAQAGDGKNFELVSRASGREVHHERFLWGHVRAVGLAGVSMLPTSLIKIPD